MTKLELDVNAVNAACFAIVLNGRCPFKDWLDALDDSVAGRAVAGIESIDRRLGSTPPRLGWHLEPKFSDHVVGLRLSQGRTTIRAFIVPPPPRRGSEVVFISGFNKKSRKLPSRNGEGRIATGNVEGEPVTNIHDRYRGSDRFQLAYEVEHLANRIRFVLEEEMENQGIKQHEIAERLRISPGRVSQLLDGRRNLTLQSLGRIAWALGMRFDPQLTPAEGSTFAPVDAASRPHQPKREESGTASPPAT